MLSLCQLLNSASQCESSHRQYENEWVWLGSNKSLRTLQFEFHVIYTCHEIFYFFQLLKVKIMLSSWAIQKQVVGMIWPIGHSLPTPILGPGTGPSL